MVGEAPAADTRAGNARVNQFVGRYMTPRHLAQAEELVALAGRFELSASVVALAWCLRQSNVASVVVGASRADQLAENASAAAVTLPDELLAELEVLFADPLAALG